LSEVLTVFEQRRILDKIEQWAERLPYSTLKIEIELPGETLTLEKNKVRPIGFTDREVKK
jgi:hypothetical protein